MFENVEEPKQLGIVEDGETIGREPFIDVERSLTLAQALAKVYAEDADIIVAGQIPHPTRFIEVPNIMYFAIVPMPQSAEDELDGVIPEFKLCLLITFQDNVIGAYPVSKWIDRKYARLRNGPKINEWDGSIDDTNWLFLDPTNPEIIVIEDIADGENISLHGLYLLSNGSANTTELEAETNAKTTRSYYYTRLCFEFWNIPKFNGTTNNAIYAELFDTVTLETLYISFWQRSVTLPDGTKKFVESTDKADISDLASTLIATLPRTIRLVTVMGPPKRVEIDVDVISFDLSNKPTVGEFTLRKLSIGLDEAFNAIAVDDKNQGTEEEDSFSGYDTDIEAWEENIRKNGNKLS